jgi:hypothetical protein
MAVTDARVEVLSEEKMVNDKKDNRKKFLKISSTKRIGIDCIAVSCIVDYI